MDFEELTLGETLYSEMDTHEYENGDKLDLRKFYWIKDITISDDDIVVIREHEDDADSLIGRFNADKLYSKKLGRSISIALDSEVINRISRFMFTSERSYNNPSCTLLKYSANREDHNNRRSRASSYVTFDFRGCPDDDSKRRKIERVWSDNSFKTMDELFNEAKDKLIDSIKSLIDSDNESLAEYYKSNYDFPLDETEEKLQGEKIDPIRSDIESLKEDVSEVNQEIKEKTKELRQKKQQIKNRIKEKRLDIIEEEMKQIHECDFPDEVIEEIEDTIGNGSKTSSPFITRGD